jgi:ribulose-5-phosphate 4-epimerase/fuculose-1-phosphate aldolase
VQRIQIEMQLLEGCRRLAGKGFIHTPADSFSIRIPGRMEMTMVAGHVDWRKIGIADLYTTSLFCKEGLRGLHASIYRERADVGAISISSPKGVRLLARSDGLLPPLFDEQVRHIGHSTGPLPDEEHAHGDIISKVFRRGANAALLGEQLLCLGMTCDRVLFNTELYEKCTQAYVIAKASGSQIGFIPWWVRLIANYRLLKDERRAAESYRGGCIPKSISTY